MGDVGRALRSGPRGGVPFKDSYGGAIPFTHRFAPLCCIMVRIWGRNHGALVLLGAVNYP